MLNHGAIIARELGIPCVNGIAESVDLLTISDLFTVAGCLGVVTVSAPEFDLDQVTLGLYSQRAEIPHEKTKEQGRYHGIDAGIINADYEPHKNSISCKEYTEFIIILSRCKRKSP